MEKSLRGPISLRSAIGLFVYLSPGKWALLLHNWFCDFLSQFRLPQVVLNAFEKDNYTVI